MRRNSFETAPISPTKRHNTETGCSRRLLRMCFHSLRAIPTDKKWFSPLPLCGQSLLLCPSSNICLWLKHLHSSPQWLHGGSLGMTNKKQTCVRSRTYECSLVSSQCSFIKKLHRKWNLSKAVCGKRCHFREMAKPYKAFPPKWST